MLDDMDYKQDKDSLKDRYAQLVPDRQPFLDRARRVAKYTIPHLYPKEGHNIHSQIDTPYQSIGAEGTNNLASKFLLGLFPPNTPFYKFSLTPAMIEKVGNAILDNGGGEDEAGQVDQELSLIFSDIETKLQKDIESKGNRKTLGEAFKHLIVSGNGLLYIAPDGQSKLYTLFHYVIKRDTMGSVLEIIVRDVVHRNTLPEHVREMLKENNNLEEEGFFQKLGSNILSVFSTGTNDIPTPRANEVEIYTCQKRIVEGKTNKWMIWQEIDGVKIDESISKLPIDDMPYIPLRLFHIDAEDYGRGYAEDYLGDLQSLDGLERGLLEIIAEAARSLIGIKPNSQNRKLIHDITKTPNGQPIIMNEGDAFPIELGKRSDFQMLDRGIERKEQRLARVFLLFQSVQRDAERVTAEEVQQVVKQLDDLLGGFFSTFANEVQLQVVKRKLATMKRRREIPQLGFDVLDISITTGIEALGRSQDLQKLQSYIQLVGAAVQTLGPIANVDNLDKRISAALHFDSKGILKSEEQLAQEREDAEQKALSAQVVPQVVNQAGNIIKEGVKANGQAETSEAAA